MKRGSGIGSAAAFVVAMAAPVLLAAQTPELAVSTDEDTRFGTLKVADYEVAATDLAGTWVRSYTALSDALPAGVSIDALDVEGPADVYLSLDTDAVVGGVRCADEDVLHWDGAVFSLAWDGSANGVPAAADLDALAVIDASPLELSLSLDIPADLPGVGVVDDSDAVRFATGAGFTALDFDASAAGVPSSFDLDALARRTTTDWLLSFDVPGRIGALVFDDADLLLWHAGTSTFDSTVWFVAADHQVGPAVDLTAAHDLTFDPAAIFADDFESGGTGAWSVAFGGPSS